MSSRFYTRYVPPKQTQDPVPEPENVNQEASPTLSKKRKRGRTGKEQPLSPSDPNPSSASTKVNENSGRDGAGGASADSTEHPERTQVGSEHVTFQESVSEEPMLTESEKPKKEKKKRKFNDENILPPQDDQSKPNNDDELNGLTKHKKIKSKFEKTAKIAERRPKQSKTSPKDAAHLDEPNAVHAKGLEPLPVPKEAPEDTTPTFSSLPTWIGKPTFVSTNDIVPISDLKLSSQISSNLESKGISKTLPIQTAVVPMLLPGEKRYVGDICISAATGSGKTLAYVLPMVEALKDKPTRLLRGLILVPTRELVGQVLKTLKDVSEGTNLVIGTAVGNRTVKEEQAVLMRKTEKYDPDAYKKLRDEQMTDEDLMSWDFEDKDEDEDEFDTTINFIRELRSNVDILVCTPGRLVEHMRSTKGFTLQHVQWLIIDEADRLLDESFQQWVEKLIPALEEDSGFHHGIEFSRKLFHIHDPRRVRKIILSATMTRDISKLVPLKLFLPRLVVTQGASGETVMNNQDAQEIFELPPTLDEVAIDVASVGEKPLFLLQILLRGLESSELWDGDGRERLPSSNLKHVKTVSTKPVESTSSSDDQSSSDETVSDIISSDGSISSSDDSASPSSTASNSKLEKIAEKPQPKLSYSEESIPAHGSLIFTHSNEAALRLTRLLCLLNPANAHCIAALTKSTSSSGGRKLLQKFNSGKVSILIASDRASRGLDIPSLARVINYDMPGSVTSYVHRIGRTARAGRKGMAITLVPRHQGRWFWNEIGKGKVIRRQSAGKVRRLDWKTLKIGDSAREAYDEALKTLGEEATNH